MKKFLRSRKGIVVIVVLAALVIGLSVFGVVKMSKSDKKVEDKKTGTTQQIQTSEEKTEEAEQSGDIQLEQSIEGGLMKPSGEVGEGNTTDITEFPNDVEENGTPETGQTGDGGTGNTDVGDGDTGNTDTGNSDSDNGDSGNEDEQGDRFGTIY